MDDFIKAMEGFIAGANKTYQNWPYKKKISSNWIECYNLWQNKWKLEEYIEVPNSDNIMVKWSKDSNKKEVMLTFRDQVIWLKFLEQNGEKNNVK